MKKLLVMAGLGFIIGVGSLSAGTITYTGTFADTQIPSPGGIVATLTGYDPTLFGGQILTGVNVTLTSISGNIQEFISNTSGSAQNYTGATQSSTFQLLGPPTSSTPVTPLGSNLTFGPCGPFSGVAGTGLTLLTACPFSSSAAINVNPVDLVDYLATTVSFNLNDISDPVSGNAPGAPAHTVSFGAGGDYQGAISVTYTYAPASTVPEPTTLFLMGSALVGCGLLRKRIKS